MAWIGSSVGSLLVKGSLRTVILLGSLATALAAIGLGECHGHGADVLMGLYGVGLGMTMTAISLIRQQQAMNWGHAQSGTEMVRLNLLWAIGACAAPSLTVRALTVGAIRPLLFGLAFCFLLLAAWAATLGDVRLISVSVGEVDDAGFLRRVARVFRKVPLGLVLMTLLITGIEASAGGWLATYARRGGHTVVATIAAPTFFWAGLLLSRLFWSVSDKWMSRRMSQAQEVQASLVLMALASVALIASGAPMVVLGAAFCLGFGIGPTYPLLLAWALQFERGGAIFFLAGVGSACLPWLTGAISGAKGSLRVGLVVPMLGTMVMLGIALLGPIGAWAKGLEHGLRRLDTD